MNFEIAHFSLFIFFLCFDYYVFTCYLIICMYIQEPGHIGYLHRTLVCCKRRQIFSQRILHSVWRYVRPKWQRRVNENTITNRLNDYRSVGQSEDLGYGEQRTHTKKRVSSDRWPDQRHRLVSGQSAYGGRWWRPRKVYFTKIYIYV